MAVEAAKERSSFPRLQAQRWPMGERSWQLYQLPYSSSFPLSIPWVNCFLAPEKNPESTSLIWVKVIISESCFVLPTGIAEFHITWKDRDITMDK